MKCHYHLALTDEQAGVIKEALDLFMRIGMGQYREILQHSPFAFQGPSPDRERYFQATEEASRLLDRAKSLLTGLEHGSYHSIGSQSISERYRMACDVHDVIRHRLSWDRVPEGDWTVDFDRPMHYVKRLPLPLMQKIEGSVKSASTNSLDATRQLEDFARWSRATPTTGAEEPAPPTITKGRRKAPTRTSSKAPAKHRKKKSGGGA